ARWSFARARCRASRERAPSLPCSSGNVALANPGRVLRNRPTAFGSRDATRGGSSELGLELDAVEQLQERLLSGLHGFRRTGEFEEVISRGSFDDGTEEAMTRVWFRR